jgi:hypothetical protein
MANAKIVSWFNHSQFLPIHFSPVILPFDLYSLQCRVPHKKNISLTSTGLLTWIHLLFKTNKINVPSHLLTVKPNYLWLFSRAYDNKWVRHQRPILPHWIYLSCLSFMDAWVTKSSQVPLPTQHSGAGEIICLPTCTIFFLWVSFPFKRLFAPCKCWDSTLNL